MDKLRHSWNNWIKWLQHNHVDKKEENAGHTAFDMSDEEQMVFDRLSQATPQEVRLELREKPSKEIIELLIDEEKSQIVGLYGMAGVGKTTLMYKVAKEVKEKALLDKLVMAIGTPSSEPRLSMKQQEKINGWLKKQEKILVIVDNIWNPKTSLKDIGIPDPFDDQYGGSMVVVIMSRSQEILSKLRIEKLILVQTLPNETALRLVKHVNGNLDDDRALEIESKCRGLPLALVEVARRISQSTQTFMLSDFVYSSLNWSFLYLENDELRCFFLLCSLFGNSEISYEHMLKYAVAESDLSVLVNLKMKDVRSRVREYMDSLKKSSLLQHGQTEHSAVMHPIVFQFAKKVGSLNHMFVGDDKIELNQWLHRLRKGNRKNWTHISLLSDSIDEPEFGDLPKPRFLHVGANYSGKSSILKMNIEGLKVLDHAGKEIIGSSIWSLKYIETLCLKDCGELEVDEIAKIGNLKSLKILSFSGTTVIHQLPYEISNLASLCMLELSCKRVQMIPPDVLSRLTQLPELHITGFAGWAELKTDHNISFGELGLLQDVKAYIDLSPHSLRFLKMTSNVS